MSSKMLLLDFDLSWNRKYFSKCRHFTKCQNSPSYIKTLYCPTDAHKL